MKVKKKNSGKIQQGVGDIPAIVIGFPFSDPVSGKLLQALIDIMVEDKTTKINDIAEMVERLEDMQAWQLANGIIVAEEIVSGKSKEGGEQCTLSTQESCGVEQCQEGSA